MADIQVSPAGIIVNTHAERVFRDTVWVTPSIGYKIYERQSNYLLYYVKTTDGGQTWSAATQLTTLFGGASNTSRNFNVWFDQWTPGDTGTKIHIVWSEHAGTSGRLRYITLDTATDTISGIVEVGSYSTSFPTLTDSDAQAVITKAIGGNLYALFEQHDYLSDVGGKILFYRSVDAGATWVLKSAVNLILSDPNYAYILLPGNETDTQDIYAARKAGAVAGIALFAYDDSADSWSTVDAGTGGPGGLDINGATRASDKHSIIIYKRPNGGNFDIGVLDVSAALTATAKTDVVTNQATLGVVSILIAPNDDLYVAYIKATEPFYKKSMDGGVTWGAETSLDDDALAKNVIRVAANAGILGGRMYGTWYQNAVGEWFGNYASSISFGLYEITVDWNNDGDFSDANEEITTDMKRMSWERGVESELERIGTGTLELVVMNATGKYSPENAASALYPNVLPGRPIRVRAFFGGTVYTKFKGYIEKITPRPKSKEAHILCVDGMDRLARNNIEAPSRGLITSLRMGAATTVSGVNITFADANPDTITRASGSFVDDGFQIGMRVHVSGSTNNNSGTGLFPPGFVIAGVTALVLTLHADEGLIAEGPVAGVTLKGYGPVGIILDEAGWPQATRSLDAGIDTLDYWWVHRQKPRDAIEDLMKVEKSLAFVKGDGTFVYEDRHHRLKGAHLTSQATFSDTMVDMEYEVSSRPIRNIAVVTGHERTPVSGAAVRLWGTRDRPRIGQGEVLTIWAHLENPAPTINVPTATTDYGISATAGGANDAALLALVPVIFTKYGQSVKMQFTNNNTQDVYIVPGTIDLNYALYIDGNEYEDDEAFVRQEDATSKTAYGDRSIAIENPFVGAFNTLAAYSQWLISRFKGINAAGTLVPIPDNVRMHLTNGSSALLTQMLAREISDRITLTVTALGVSAKEYYINKISEEVSEGGMVHNCTWWLERVDESKYWLLETTNYGELEQNTRVGF